MVNLDGTGKSGRTGSIAASWAMFDSTDIFCEEMMADSLTVISVEKPLNICWQRPQRTSPLCVCSCVALTRKATLQPGQKVTKAMLRISSNEW